MRMNCAKYGLASLLLLLIILPGKSEKNKSVVDLVVNWENIVGTLTADHWGVNDMGAGFKKVNIRMAEFYEQMQPGIIRMHHSKMVNSWVNNETRSWNTEKIKLVFDNVKETYSYGKRVMLTLDGCPAFISDKLPLTESQEDELAAFFAQLPVILKDMGYRVDLYEFLNENHLLLFYMATYLYMQISQDDLYQILQRLELIRLVSKPLLLLIPNHT